MISALKHHWPEYLIESAGLGFFMVAACFGSAILWYPSSPVHLAITSPVMLRGLMGGAMGLTAVAIVYSPWGKRSGAHINPAFTLTFFRLGKIEPWDAAFYILFQFLGAAVGVLVAALFLGAVLAAPTVDYAVTVPGPAGAAVAFVAESAIAFVLMWVVLLSTNSKNYARFTGLFVGLLLMVYITIESPLSGMSMNPARTLGSAASARVFTSLWVYFTAPILGMLLAAEAYVRLRSIEAVGCAKLHHNNNKRCIFRCGYRR